jgi:hypothetical protein
MFQNISGLNGLNLGPVYDAAPDLADGTNRSAYVVVGGAAGGVFHTADLGNTWTNVTNNATITAQLQSGNLTNARLADSAAATNPIYLAIADSGALSGVFRSGNTGASWAAMDLPQTLDASRSITSIDGATPNVVTVSAGENYGTGDRVRISGAGKDNGDWTIVAIDNTHFSLNTSAGGAAVGAAGTAKVFQGINRGGQAFPNLTIAADPTSANLVYIAGDAEQFPDRNQPNRTPTDSSLGANDFTARIFRGNASVAAQGPGAVITDATHQWSALVNSGTANNSAPHADSRAMVIDAGQLLYSCDGGINEETSPTDATGHWVSRNGGPNGANNGLQVTQFFGISYDGLSDIILGGAQDTGTPQQRAAQSQDYVDQTGSDGSNTAVDDFTDAPGDSLRYIGSTREEYDTANNNVGTNLNIIPAGGVSGFSGFTSLAVSTVAPPAGQSTRVVIVNGSNTAMPPVTGALFEATNAGTAATAAAINYSQITTGAGWNGVNEFIGSRYPAIVVGGMLNGAANQNVIYAASGNQIFLRSAATGMGSTLSATPGQPVGANNIYSVAVDPNNWNTAYAVDFSGIVYQTTDAGKTWNSITGNLNQTNVRSITVVDGTGSNAGNSAVLVGASAGVFRMLTNAPKVWTKFGQSFPNSDVWGLTYSTSTDKLVAGTSGRGAFELQNTSAGLFVSNTQTGVEGAPQAFNLGSFSDSDGGGPWLVDVNWGDGTPDTTFNVSATGSLGTQTHTYGEERTYLVTFTVTDTTQGDYNGESFPVTVSDPAVVQGPPVAVNPVEGAAFTGLAVAKFTDPGGAEPNPSDPTPGIGNHYSVVSIDWGDNNPLDTTTGSLSFGGAPGSKTDPFTVSGSHTYGEEGTFTIRVVIDHEGMRTTLTSMAIVSDPPVLAQGVNVTAKECIAFQAPVAMFSDPGGAEPNPSDPTGGIPDHYTATVDFGDGKGASPAVITFNGAPGSKTDLFTVTATHTFDEEGIFTVTATINHEGIITVAHSTATVRDNFGLLLLDPTDDKSLMVTGNGSVTVTNCGAVVVDSSDPRAIFLTGNAVVTATEADVGLGGDAVIHGHATLNLLEPEFNHEAATPDPFALPLPPAPANHVPGVQISTGAVTLSPGTYDGGIAVTGDGSVTLLPGIYYMNGGGFSVSGQGSVTDNGSGVLIVNAPTGPSDRIQFDGQASVSLAAISGLTGALAPYNHMTILQDPASDNTVMITGQASLTMTGVLYAPAALLKIDGDGSAVVSTDTNPTGGIVVAFDAMVTGNGALTINADPPDFAVPGEAGSASATATASAATALAPPSAAARAPHPVAPVVGDTDFASVQASLALTRPVAPATVIVIGNLSPNGPEVLIATTKVSPAPAPAAVSISANLSGGGDTGEDGMPDATAVPNDQQPAPMAAATPLLDREPSNVLRLQACDALFAVSHWAPATSGRLAADAAQPPAVLGSARDAPPALVASEGAEQKPSLLAAASLALGLGWWSVPRRREQELHRRPVLK